MEHYEAIKTNELPILAKVYKEKNKVEFFSREEAIEKKYKPCDRCKPGSVKSFL